MWYMLCRGVEVKQSIHYFGFHSYHDSAKLAPFITMKQFRLNLGCAEPSSLFISGERLQMLTELLLLAKFLALDLDAVMALQWGASSIIWLNIISAATAPSSQPSLLTLGVSVSLGASHSELTKSISGSQVFSEDEDEYPPPQPSTPGIYPLSGANISTGAQGSPHKAHMLVFSCKALTQRYYDYLF